MVELAGIELEAFSGREGVFKEDDRESAAEILSIAEGPGKHGMVELAGIEPAASSLRILDPIREDATPKKPE